MKILITSTALLASSLLAPTTLLAQGSDSCATPTPISGIGSHAFDTTSATTGIEGQNECGTITSDVWFEWTSSGTGTCVITTCGTASHDTKLAAYPAGGCPVDGTSIACNDDACGLQSQIAFTVTTGVTYLLQTGSFGTVAGGPGLLDISICSPPVNDDCATPIVISGLGTFAFDNNCAVTGTQGQAECGSIHNDIWFAWTASANGLAVVQTCSIATNDTRLAAYPGSACPADGTSIACNDDACSSYQSQITFPVTSAGVYLIQLGNYAQGDTATGAFDISIVPPIAEDECSTPGLWIGEGIFPFDCTFATTGTEGQNELNCDKFGQTGIGYDLWYTWRPSTSGFATLTTCSTATWDTKIALWPGTGCPVDGTSLTCNDDTCALQSMIVMSVIAGNDYTIQIGSYPLTGTHTAAAVEITVDSIGIGTNYCAVNANSTGSPAIIFATGSSSIAANNLTMAAEPVPNQPGIFFHASNQSEIPFGNGFLCTIGTIVRMAPIVAQGNRAESVIDLASTSITVPATVNWQFWYRDPAAGGAFFNTSDAVSINFIP